jgi:hypothetical protein
MSKFHVVPFTYEDVWHARQGEFLAMTEQALHIALLKVSEDPEPRLKKIIMVEMAFYVNEPEWQKIQAAKQLQYETTEPQPFKAEEKALPDEAGGEANDEYAGYPCLLFMTDAAMRMYQDLGVAPNVIKTIESHELPYRLPARQSPEG